MRRSLVIGAVIVLGACATVRAKDKMSQLQDSVEAYNEAYRWKNYERAASYLPNDLRASFVATYEDDEKSLHVEDYQVLKVDMDGEDAAHVLVSMRFMLLPSVTVETRKLIQHWHLIEGSWTMESEENSIRRLDPSAKPKSADDFGGDDAPPGADIQIQVTDPKGAVIRDQTTEDEPFPQDP